MQTAAGGPLKIKFTPEQIAQFENQATRIPGMNNSGRDRYIKEGVQAQQHQEQETKRKEEEIKSRMEMRPTLKRRATIAEKLQGKKDEYKQVPQVVGMSGADPVGEFIVETIGLNGIGALAKTGLWNIAKYAPTTQLGNWGRQYFVGNAFKNSFNGAAPTLTSQATSLLYQPAKQNETGLTSLKFFERPSKISEAESLGFGRSKGFNPEFGSDLHEFYTLQDRRRTMQDALRKLKAPEDMGVDETISKNSGSIIEDGYLMSNGYRYTPVTEKHFSTGTNMSFGRQGIGGSGHNYGLNLGGESTRVRDLGKESKITYSTPKTNLNRDDHTNLDVVITAENDKANKKGIKLLTKGMRDMESGAEFSGDASSTTAAEAVSSWLRLAKNKPQLREIAMSNAKIALDNNAGISLGKHTVTDPIHGIITENATMSPDAYSYLYRTAANNPDKFHLGYTMKAGNFNSFARNPKNAYMYDVEQNYLDGLITPQEYIKQFNSWSIPLGGRRAYFYNGRVYKPQPFLIRNKQGGKMNILEFLKNGSGIHIKEKNKGKFTSYCGGKVTDECIQKGKNSSNPAIRKRATFAANSRKWKHEKGGLLKFEEGGKNGAPSTKFLSKQWFKKAGNTINNIGNNIGDFLKTDAGKGIMDIGQNILSGYTNYKKASNLLDSQIEQSKASLEQAYQDTIQQAVQNRAIQQWLIKEQWKEAYQNGETLDNYSDIVASHMGYDQYSNSLQNAEQQKKQQQALLDQQASDIKGNMMGNLFGSVVQSGLGVLGNVLGGGGSSFTTKTTTTTPKTTPKTTTNHFASPLNDPTKFWSIA